MPTHKLEPEFWVERYSDALLSFARTRIKDRDLAKDLVQDAFVVALRSKENFRGEISEKNWLFLVLKSRILDHYKKKKEVLESDLAPDDSDPKQDYFNEKGHWMVDRAPKEWTTDRMLLNKEFMTVFEACKGLLTDTQALVFTMKYLDGDDADDICKELNISSSNYWVIIHRAKLQLRNCLEKNWMQ